MKIKTKTPFMSVIISSFNGADTLGRTIESLLSQDYPKSRFEIIVVDDGSSDDTGKVAAGYKVQVVRLERNSGISTARNAGLKIARGQVFVGIDDDCIAYPDLLSQLAHGYDTGNPAGVGGYLADPKQLNSLLKHYMVATGTGPAPTSTAGSSSPFGRLISFLRSKVRKLAHNQPAILTVDELYGANGSFPIDVLRGVGGWDVEMSGIEDRDLSRRIKQSFPDRPFYALRDAKIIHDPDSTLWQYLLRPYRRGSMNLKFYQRNSQLPPVFPFPLIAFLLVAITAVTSPRFVPLVLLLTPQVMNFWWPYRAITEHRALFLLFPYIELTEEAMVIAGIMRGYAHQMRRRHAGN